MSFKLLIRNVFKLICLLCIPSQQFVCLDHLVWWLILWIMVRRYITARSAAVCYCHYNVYLFKHVLPLIDRRGQKWAVNHTSSKITWWRYVSYLLHPLNNYTLNRHWMCCFLRSGFGISRMDHHYTSLGLHHPKKWRVCQEPLTERCSSHIGRLSLFCASSLCIRLIYNS